MAEILDIVDEQGRPTGQTVPRTVAHAEGIRHRTSHVWIVRRHAGRIEVLLQMRCQAKDSFPGCYDISSAGHIPAGCDYVESALRELREELASPPMREGRPSEALRPPRATRPLWLTDPSREDEAAREVREERMLDLS